VSTLKALHWQARGWQALGKAVLRALRWLAWLADEALDRVPAIEGGHWYWYGGWGCRLRMHRLWAPEDGERDGKVPDDPVFGPPVTRSTYFDY
jgi:hypothetical protein